MAIIHIDRGRMAETTPAVVSCLWENWDIYDALLGKRWNIQKVAPNMFVGHRWGVKAEVRLVSCKRDARMGIFHFIVTSRVLGAPVSTTITLKYAVTVTGETAAQGVGDVEAKGLFGLILKIFHGKLQKLADMVILDGIEAATLVIKNLPEAAKRLSKEQRKILYQYLNDETFSIKRASSKQFFGESILEILPAGNEEIIRFETTVPKPRRIREKIQVCKKRTFILREMKELAPLAEKIRTAKNIRNKPILSMSGNEFYAKAKKIGKDLYNSYIPRNIHAALTSMLDYHANTQLRIETEGKNILLPWELLHNGDDFLCILTALARTTTNIIRPASKKLQSIKGILIVGSDPRYDLDNVKREVEALANGIKEEIEGINVRQFLSYKATKENIIRELETGEYQILHYCGHSEYKPDDPGQSYLLLSEESKLMADELARLSVEGILQLVFLNSCSSGRSSTLNEGVLGIADSFVKIGVPFVIGMMWKITDDGGLLLAKEFYKTFIKTKDPVRALSKARSIVGSIFDWQDPTWAAPIIYTQ